MRREVLVGAVSKIINDLKQCKVSYAIDEVFESLHHPNGKRDEQQIRIPYGYI